MDTINGKYGQFDLSRPATYIIHDLGMETSWEYIFRTGKYCSDWISMDR